LENGRIPERSELEEIFRDAIRIIKSFAKRENIWDIEVVRKYWREEHNRVIEGRQDIYSTATDLECELCKVYETQVVSAEREYLKVRINNKEKKVRALLIPDAKAGERVTIHQGYAIEKL